MSEGGRVLPFSIQRPERAGIELVTRLAPSHSLVGSLIAEAGMAKWDAAAGIAAELTHQARAMEACFETETVIIKLRGAGRCPSGACGRNLPALPGDC